MNNKYLTKIASTPGLTSKEEDRNKIVPYLAAGTTAGAVVGHEGSELLHSELKASKLSPGLRRLPGDFFRIAAPVAGAVLSSNLYFHNKAKREAEKS
jgi:hypothetical protein